MIDLERYRQQVRKHVLAALGLAAGQARGFVAEVESVGLEAQILALPFLGGTADLQPLQDPVTGEVLFMVGISAVGGDDPIGF